MGQGFSFASVILSYFLVGGGMFTATLLGAHTGLRSEAGAYVLFAAGAFVGGFIAARASRGRTLLEPAIGAVAVVATIVGLAATTQIGQLIWALASDQTIKLVASVGGTGVVGALAGAFVSEKVLGESTRSSIPWIAYTAMSTFGACLLVTLFAVIFFSGRVESSGLAEAPATVEVTTTAYDVGAALLYGMGAGCLLSGLAAGASARVRPLLACFLGGGIGIAGLFALFISSAPGSHPTSEAAAGLAILASVGAVLTLIGAAIGWAAVGRNQPA